MHSVDSATSYCRNRAQEERKTTKRSSHAKMLSETSPDGKHIQETECSGSGGAVVKQ